jgi:hypothetical protein
MDKERVMWDDEFEIVWNGDSPSDDEAERLIQRIKENLWAVTSEADLERMWSLPAKES